MPASTSPASAASRLARRPSHHGIGKSQDVQPATAVVSLVNPGGTGPVRSSFCNQVHYFVSREDARAWLETHPGGEVLDIEAAHRAGAAIAASMLSNTTAEAPVSDARHDCCAL